MVQLRKRKQSPTSKDPEQKSPKKLRQLEKPKSSNKADIFPFLDLPAELRNRIYIFVAQDAGAFLFARNRGRLLSRTGLCKVNRQINEEYQSMLCTSSSVIEARVINFDFGHVIKFLNGLSESELSCFRTAAVPTNRRIVLSIIITKACDGVPAGLQRWLARCECPAKKGASLDVTYAAQLGGKLQAEDHLRSFLRRYVIGTYQWISLPSCAEKYPGAYNASTDVSAYLRRVRDRLPPGRILTEVHKILPAVTDLKGILMA